MAEPNSPQSDSPKSNDFDIDQLLNQVEQLANRAEKLVTQTGVREKKENLSPTPANDAEDTAAPAPEAETEPAMPTEGDENDFDQVDLAQLDELMQQQAGTMETELPVDEIENTPANVSEDHSSTVSDKEASEAEVAVDEQTELMAEDEINQVFSRLQNKSLPDELSPAPAEAQKTPPPPIAEACPRFFRHILVFFFAVNRPFLWLPRSARDILGYIGLATLFFALGLWIVTTIVKK